MRLEVFRLKNRMIKYILYALLGLVSIILLYLLTKENKGNFIRLLENLETNDSARNTKPKACLFILIRNRELDNWVDTMKEFEKNFNSKYNYPYIFMNNEPFTQNFKDTVLNLTNSTVEFGLVPKEHWSIPNWIDMDKFNDLLETSLRKMWSGTKVSYHHMCRYYSGFFFRENLTLKYDYFWRIEPGVSFPCEISYDPFQFMVDNKKLYGFSIARPEMMDTIPSLWKTINDWLKKGYKHYLSKNNAIDFISNDDGKTLDRSACTFFNNFEIGAFSVFRDKLYLDYFDFLDKSGGFFYERWGDSAINTFYLVMMLNKTQIHNFDDFPYFHPPRYFCPKKTIKNCDQNLIEGCQLTSTSEHCYNKWLKVIKQSEKKKRH